MPGRFEGARALYRAGDGIESLSSSNTIFLLCSHGWNEGYRRTVYRFYAQHHRTETGGESSARGLQDLRRRRYSTNLDIVRRFHEIIAELMPAPNMYFALYELGT